jgi:ABC-type uncharacterized transport system ATPase subunit
VLPEEPLCNGCVPARITCNAGTAVLLISEDLDGILELADRIVVRHDGQVVHKVPAEGADPQEIGRHMLGHH